MRNVNSMGEFRPPSQGLTSGNPKGAKSLTLRVTSVWLCARAVAARNPSIACRAIPRRVASAINSPHRSATRDRNIDDSAGKSFEEIDAKPGVERRFDPAIGLQSDPP